jgi:hypothetical protein
MPNKQSRQKCKKEKYAKIFACHVVSYKRNEEVDDMPVRLVVFKEGT